MEDFFYKKKRISGSINKAVRFFKKKWKCIFGGEPAKRYIICQKEKLFWWRKMRLLLYHSKK